MKEICAYCDQIYSKCTHQSHLKIGYRRTAHPAEISFAKLENERSFMMGVLPATIVHYDIKMDDKKNIVIYFYMHICAFCLRVLKDYTNFLSHNGLDKKYEYLEIFGKNMAKMKIKR